jgi:hypothetical protein
LRNHSSTGNFWSLTKGTMGWRLSLIDKCSREPQFGGRAIEGEQPFRGRLTDLRLRGHGSCKILFVRENLIRYYRLGLPALQQNRCFRHQVLLESLNVL